MALQKHKNSRSPRYAETNRPFWGLSAKQYVCTTKQKQRRRKKRKFPRHRGKQNATRRKMPINKTHVLPVQTLRTSKVYIYCPGIVLGRATQRRQLRQRWGSGGAPLLLPPDASRVSSFLFQLGWLSGARAASRLCHLRNSTASETSAPSPCPAHGGVAARPYTLVSSPLLRSRTIPGLPLGCIYMPIQSVTHHEQGTATEGRQCQVKQFVERQNERMAIV